MSVRHPEHEIPLLPHRVIGVRHEEGERIAERGYCLVECHTVLSGIGLRFFRVPLEYVAHLDAPPQAPTISDQTGGLDITQEAHVRVRDPYDVLSARGQSPSG